VRLVPLGVNKNQVIFCGKSMRTMHTLTALTVSEGAAGVRGPDADRRMLEELELQDHCACPGDWCNVAWLRQLKINLNISLVKHYAVTAVTNVTILYAFVC